MKHGLRKQRTRQHVIADLAIHHVEGFILQEGHTAQRVQADYGYDLIMMTFDENEWVEPGLVWIQCKATERLAESGNSCAFDIDFRDYVLWTTEERPVILIVYDALTARAWWVCIQEHFRDPARRPKKGTRTARVRIPKRNEVNRQAIREIRELIRMARLPAIFPSDS